MVRSVFAAVVCLLLFISAPARAGLVSLDFEEFGTPILIDYNVSSHGFRISPKCHIDVRPNPEGGVAIGGDTSGCFDRPNSNFLGAGISTPFPAYGNWVYFDYGGVPFSFESYEAFGENALIISSKGGVIGEFGGWIGDGDDVVDVSVSGGEWSGVRWIMASLDGPGQPVMFLDNMTFRVPSPGTLPLVAVAMVALLFGRRKHGPINRTR
jgi:hypothetical protein